MELMHRKFPNRTEEVLQKWVSSLCGAGYQVLGEVWDIPSEDLNSVGVVPLSCLTGLRRRDTTEDSQGFFFSLSLVVLYCILLYCVVVKVVVEIVVVVTMLGELAG